MGIFYIRYNIAKRAGCYRAAHKSVKQDLRRRIILSKMCRGALVAKHDLGVIFRMGKVGRAKAIAYKLFAHTAQLLAQNADAVQLFPCCHTSSTHVKFLLFFFLRHAIGRSTAFFHYSTRKNALFGAAILYAHPFLFSTHKKSVLDGLQLTPRREFMQILRIFIRYIYIFGKNAADFFFLYTFFLPLFHCLTKDFRLLFRPVSAIIKEKRAFPHPTRTNFMQKMKI